MGSSNSSQSDGASPRTPDGVVVYAIGDVHGRADLLRALLTGIECDAALRPHARPVLVFLGDYVDRGPDSKAVIERLALGAPATGPLAGAGWIALRGNHEDLLLAFLDQADKGRVWRANGGLDTLRSYLGDLPPLDSEALRLPFERALPKAHRRFLESLALTHREGDYLFVHAGLRPGIALTDQRPEDLMWIREPFLRSSEDFGPVVVHGHSVTPTPVIRRNRIGIDTGAYRSGRLTALALEGTDCRFLTAHAGALDTAPVGALDDEDGRDY